MSNVVGPRHRSLCATKPSHRPVAAVRWHCCGGAGLGSDTLEARAVPSRHRLPAQETRGICPENVDRVRLADSREHPTTDQKQVPLPADKTVRVPRLAASTALVVRKAISAPSFLATLLDSLRARIQGSFALRLICHIFSRLLLCREAVRQRLSLEWVCRPGRAYRRASSANRRHRLRRAPSSPS